MFISFEGIDGSGKTTQAHRLAEHLRARGQRVIEVRDPGGTVIGEQIRALLLDPGGDVASRAELLLFAAARAQLVEQVIRPALSNGAVVVADRFYDSTTAYQGGGRQVLSLDGAASFHAFVTGGLSPDLTILVDLDAESARKRRLDLSNDRMEAADRSFHERVREAYLALARCEPARITVVDGSRDEETITNEIVRLVNRIAERRG